MVNLNGSIMSKDKIIATVKNNKIVESESALLPLFLKRTGNVIKWLENRAIDTHRTNSRLLKKALRLGSLCDVQLVLKVNAAVITDTYWFCDNTSNFRYEDVRFKVNYFDKLALKGDPDSFNQEYSPTPELTNIGSFEKCWRIADGKWYIIKSGNELERFSELFICKLGQKLGFQMADYTAENGTIKSPDFTDNAAVNYESADGIVGDEEDYAYNFDMFWKLSPELAKQYLQIIYLDTICFNMDRHTKNYGVLRNVENGEIICMAPNFDNNIALFSRGVPKNLNRENDKLISLFVEFIKKDNRALKIVKKFPIPVDELVKKCMSEIKTTVDYETVRTFIMNGVEVFRCCL